MTLVLSIEELNKNVLILFLHGLLNTKQKSLELLDLCELLYFFLFLFPSFLIPFLPASCLSLKGLLME